MHAHTYSTHLLTCRPHLSLLYHLRGDVRKYLRVMTPHARYALIAQATQALDALPPFNNDKTGDAVAAAAAAADADAERAKRCQRRCALHELRHVTGVAAVATTTALVAEANDLFALFVDAYTGALQVCVCVCASVCCKCVCVCVQVCVASACVCASVCCKCVCVCKCVLQVCVCASVCVCVCKCVVQVCVCMCKCVVQVCASVCKCVLQVCVCVCVCASVC
jgi:hypothetical protein